MLYCVTLSSMLINILNYDKFSLFEEISRQIGAHDGEGTLKFSCFNVDQILRWIYCRSVFDFAQMTDLSCNLRKFLSQKFEVRLPSIALKQQAKDGVVKWLLTLDCGSEIETVYIPEKFRGTLCISSQVGCKLNCKFCHTGTQAFMKNLSFAEIVGQVLLAKEELEEHGGEHGGENVKNENNTVRNHELSNKITNVVFMGMGEPMFNYDNVMKVANFIISDESFNFSRRRVTISTVGLVDKIRLFAEQSAVMLAISLHSAVDQVRDSIMPINKKFDLNELRQACIYYQQQPGSRYVTLEYVMLNNVNDSLEDAQELVNFMSGLDAKVNLIPFNSWPGTLYKPTSSGKIQVFKDFLINNGKIATIRHPRGRDIMAACGQLVTSSKGIPRVLA